MKTEFVSFPAADGAVLQGLYFEPKDESSRGVIHLHGLAGNFYENNFVMEMARAYTRQGLAFLSFNNRGHDYISDIAVTTESEKEDFKGGGAYERFSECCLDLDAALTFARVKGLVDICIQGHSSGCNKAVFALSKNPSESVRCAILLSPCDDIGITRSYLKGNLDAGLVQARELLAAGKGEDLVDPDKTIYPMCARTYLDYYEDGSDQDVFPYRNPDAPFDALAALDVPMIVTFGTDGEYIVDTAEETIAVLKRKVKAPDKLTGMKIEGAPHNYAGKEEELVERIAAWLNATLK